MTPRLFYTGLRSTISAGLVLVSGSVLVGIGGGGLRKQLRHGTHEIEPLPMATASTLLAGGGIMILVGLPRAVVGIVQLVEGTRARRRAKRRLRMLKS